MAHELGESPVDPAENPGPAGVENITPKTKTPLSRRESGVFV